MTVIALCTKHSHAGQPYSALVARRPRLLDAGAELTSEFSKTGSLAEESAVPIAFQLRNKPRRAEHQPVAAPQLHEHMSIIVDFLGAV
ncbi:hypothetical protein OG716_05355 [Nocardia sp. NBC_01388]